MDELIMLVEGKIGKITDFDRMMASDYIAYYGIDKTEIKEYADSFLEECYHYNSETGYYESNDADEIPMAEKKFDTEKSVYSYGGQTITKFN